jgi:putative ABC transport system ATP-binding protein
VSAVVARAEALGKRWGKGPDARVVLDGADLELRAGELLAVVGQSGSGKSTLLGILGGLDRHWTGRVEVLGQDLAKLSDAALSRLRGEKVGFVFQAFHLLGHLSVIDNVLAPSLFSRDGADLSPRARALLDRLGLAGREDDTIAHLSGGQRQRVAIARALLVRPALLLCDEPTGNLDLATGEAMASLFRDVAHDEGVAVLAATHSESLAAVADRVLRLNEGRLA